MRTIIKNFKNHNITCSVIKMGNDFNISIYGGDMPHIGALALGIPRESLEDKNKISSSVSLLTITGHKEDSIVQRAAKKLSKELNSTISVCCGIHIENITFEDIKELDILIDELIDELIIELNLIIK